MPLEQPTLGDDRRFEESDVELLMKIINGARLSIWQQQPDSFFEEALLDADGTLAPTTGPGATIRS